MGSIRLLYFRKTMIIAILISMYSASYAAEEGYERDPLKIDEYILNLIETGEKDLAGEFYLGRFADRVYFLRAPIHWKPNEPGPLPSVTAPKGFLTDFASIPPLFYSFLLPDGNYAAAAVIHDYLYWRQEFDREIADLILWEAMNDLKVNRITAALIYGAVRAGGWLAWESNRKAKMNGEKKILAKFPQDLNITLEEWQNTPGVFKN